MRAFASLAALGAVVLLSGCAAQNRSIVGTWESEPMPIQGGQVGVVTTTFNADKTIAFDSTLNVQGNSIKLHFNGTYTQEGDKLNISVTDGKLDMEGDATAKAAFAAVSEGLKKQAIEEANKQYSKPTTIKWIDDKKIELHTEGQDKPAVFTRKS